MKKILLILLIFILSIQNVFAKDSIYSMNHYQEEMLLQIVDTGNDNEAVIAGEITEAKEEVEKHTVIVICYKKNGEKKWTYKREQEGNSYLIKVLNTNNEFLEGDRNPNGHILLIKEELKEKEKYLWVKIDLEGNLLWEKELSFEEGEQVENIFKVTREFSEQYVGISHKDNTSYLFLYNNEGDLLWKKQFDNTLFTELNVLYENNEASGFLVIKEEREDDILEAKQLVKFDLEGNGGDVVVPSLEKYKEVSISSKNNQVLLYGITEDVKLKKGNFSYFMINYNGAFEEEWETIGDIPLDSKTKPIITDATINGGYLLFYKNEIDSSYEVVEFDNDGVYQKKVKKIKNDYYNIHNFLGFEKTLYFVGQINCPKDEHCDNDKKSLYLLSTEDTVIEVEDNDSTNVLIIGGAFVILLLGAIYIRRKRRLK